ncbi:class I SAM-dependent methyltransferase [Nocardioides sp. JQ2195]|uniref:class I SAM-dependent methyltransferase n=1 Tax=Nocardioides sp. JQ2195 TaxID=2592334 RepID=UPI00143E9C67|nr:class I SAM-dependent methyltransferase [Nocardioides sp. JQ2195]QIX25388.1 class I SAM-dependent methyltransferase [Nocardioides sp. JQ2195]
MNRHQFLAGLHEAVRPRTYLETGVQTGQSLQLSRVPSIGIDPAFTINREIQADVHLARTTSDEFFAREDPLAHLPIPIVDLAFIDGMHLAEYALRDFIAVERFTTPASVMLFDDTLPLNVLMANRKRESGSWTGDVYKATQALRDLRPDLVVIDLDTALTGTTLVLCPDASRGGALEGYDDWVESAITPDPQPVPEAILGRTNALDPERVLASAGWRNLVELRSAGRADAAAIRAGFSDVLG